MNDTLEIQPARGPLQSSIRPPGSKSLTNRALLIAALAEGTSLLRGALASDDTRVMLDCLQKLGLETDHQEGPALMQVVGGGGQLPQREAELFVGNSGTSVRFLTAMLAMVGGRYRLDGVPRMRQRPIGPLVEALQSLGVGIEALSPGQCPPVVIDSAGVTGGRAQIDGQISSQYLSGLLMAAPVASDTVVLEIKGELISRPYVEMTCRVMEAFGVTVHQDAPHRFTIPGGQRYRGCDYAVEPDASAASYFWAAAAILGGTATVLGLDRCSLQGDVAFVDCLAQMGCQVDVQPGAISVTGPARQGIHVDMGHVSDTVQTLSAVALFVEGPTTIVNVAHNRVKETDRIGNLAIELRKCGATVEERDDGLTIIPGPTRPAEIDTYDDHRMAMSLALVGLKQPGIVIRDPGCTAKTYPRYFEDLAAFLQ